MSSPTRKPAAPSIAVVAHIDRGAMAETLAATVGAAHISFDDGTLKAEGNHRRAWTWHQQQHSDWAVTLEDDAVPIEDFQTQLAAALAVAPTPITSLYLGRKRPPQHQRSIADAIANADHRGACWIITNTCFHAVGLAIRTELLDPILHHLTAHPLLPIDEALSTFTRLNRHSIGYTYPSLVDHVDGPTLVRHRDGAPRSKGRVAWKTGVRTLWTAESVTL